jgi:phosphatidylglycerol:prolipoprotein diacylglycerol transferase
VTFPVMLDAFGVGLHPHAVFEALGYFVGFRVYLWRRRRQGDAVASQTRWSVIAAAALGGALGSKLLYLLEDPAIWARAAGDPVVLIAGKSIVGGLLGGLIAVEVTKWAIGERRSTGDLFAVPLCVGMAIGRVGCFLTGLADHTHGVPTGLPWGVDFGDGVPRHPAQLYEILYLLALAPLLARLSSPRLRPGDVFKLFMAAYLAFRLAVDAWKPGVPIALGLTAIQWACVGGLGYYARDMIRLVQAWREGGDRRDAATSAA